MNRANLTFAETATIKGLLEPSGGTLKFQKGGSVSGTVNSKNSSLALQTSNLIFTGKLQTNANTAITGANLLNLSQGATLEVAGSLTLDDAKTGSSTILKINADTTITRDSPFTVGSVLLAGNTLTLGSAATDLIIDNSAPAEGESAGTFKMQEADLTWTGPVKFSTAKVYSTGGTLTLASGSSLSASGLIELSNGSKLTLNGKFTQSGGKLSANNTTIQVAGDYSKTGGDLTSSNASLKLTNDLTLSSDTPLLFKDLNLNGNVLSFGQQTSSFTLSDELIINTPNGRIVQGSTSLQLNGGLRIDSGGVLRLTDTFDTGSAKIKLNGGLLAIDSDTTLNSSIENHANSTIEIADTKNLIYEGATLNIGAHELSIIGGGTFSNTNPLQLNNASKIGRASCRERV